MSEFHYETKPVSVRDDWALALETVRMLAETYYGEASQNDEEHLYAQMGFLVIMNTARIALGELTVDKPAPEATP